MILNSENDVNLKMETSESLSEETEMGPMSVVITNVPTEVFDDHNERVLFESEFEVVDDSASFHYLGSVSRVKVDFRSPTNAAEACIFLNQKVYKGNNLKCFLIKPVVIGKSSHLEPPKREKQFLISPPASPPVGWEPSHEAHPIIDYDLINAIASLGPGEVHELHPPNENQPRIVVHVCDGDAGSSGSGGIRIPQTKAPPRQLS